MIASIAWMIRDECRGPIESRSDSSGCILIVDLELVGPSPDDDPPVV
jgi:hypothetical protein